MASLSKEYLLKSLINLLPTEEQMKTAGLFIRTFKKDYKEIVDGWMFVYNRSSTYHRLNLLYLANEVVQTTRDVDPDSIELKILLKKAVNQVFEETKKMAMKNPSLYRKYCELEKVWIQRSVMVMESHGINLGELIRNIEKSFNDKSKLSIVLEDALAKVRESSKQS
ncbi:uncharacterized protein Eint_010500 [Encephalitozoon intestinalis ATCC 50506]|uniref:CID domain-containing protein n=1 Tax=Encephalitozoon intestinalis (strain ATCC 50506) TaxID=876142 RepID=E0S5C8_ENCIT|nr:uncharacterized protein Eint_010500 [Encephalitozoon intestinalis ATCC 50506]ADM10913.1 hypothetical protein Eint_010500 [Encephalitozoon intestinalis ATCC 50506]UTX44547.1 CID domain-containing protein [Encephalitozoon intestinalis]